MEPNNQFIETVTIPLTKYVYLQTTLERIKQEVEALDSSMKILVQQCPQALAVLQSNGIVVLPKEIPEEIENVKYMMDLTGYNKILEDKKKQQQEKEKSSIEKQ